MGIDERLRMFTLAREGEESGGCGQVADCGWRAVGRASKAGAAPTRITPGFTCRVGRANWRDTGWLRRERAAAAAQRAGGTRATRGEERRVGKGGVRDVENRSET